MTFLIAAAAGAYFAQSSLLDRMPKEHKEDLLVAKDKATIMIMGVDERSDDVGRSDTLMVATIDPVRKETSLLSIPRDTRVAIPKNGYDKINAAYAYGGERLTQATVEDFLGVRIDHYVIINTHAFQKIVDAIGGIDIDVEKRMYYEDPWDDDGGLIIDLRPGMQHMDGKTAVTYVRYRDEEGDIGRVRRGSYPASSTASSPISASARCSSSSVRSRSRRRGGCVPRWCRAARSTSTR